MGAVQSRLSFDASQSACGLGLSDARSIWIERAGKRRDVSWAPFINVPVALWQSGKITRGFTGPRSSSAKRGSGVKPAA